MAELIPRHSVSSEGSSYAPSEAIIASPFIGRAKNPPSRTNKRLASEKLFDHTELEQPPTKRIREYYSDDYRRLFNITLREMKNRFAVKKPGMLKTSQIGAVRWSPEEKHKFFNALSRRGRHDLKEIAMYVGSKSEPEIAQYLSLLQSSLKAKELHASRPLRPPDYDSAREISRGCCEAIDRSAEALSRLQQKVEYERERKEHGWLWLMTPKTVKWVKACSKDEHYLTVLQRDLPAAELLDLENFLALSRDLFMNSTDMDYNYRSYTKKSRPPSMLYTAFTDFHTLTLSITKRLIQSCLFFAMSRLRALNFSGARQHPLVRAIDVEAALNVLGMKRNAKKYWPGVARKCKLNVYERMADDEPGTSRHYSYDQVEEMLDPDYETDSEIETETSHDEDASSGTHILELATATDGDSDSIQSSRNGTSGSSQGSHQSHSSTAETEPLSKDEQREIFLDDYLEALDMQNSCAEEQQLWKAVGQAPEMETAIENVKIPNVPALARKDKLDYSDWIDWTDYCAEWEGLAIPLDDSDATE